MAHTDAAYSVNAIGMTATPEQDAAVRGHLRRLETSLRAHATGDTYVNFLDLDAATPERVRAAYSPGDRQRLTALKATYDLQNTFRFNRNIAGPGSAVPTPSAGPAS